MELGYRVQPAETLFLDLALFYNKYDNLQTFATADSVGFPNPADPLGPPILLPAELVFDNEAKGTSQGLELAVDWHLREWWRLQASYSYLRISVDIDSDSDDTTTAAVLESSSPRHQLSVRSAMDISNDWSLDLWAYYVDELAVTSYSNAQAIPDYLSLNARLAWRPGDNLELSLVGQNLLDNLHQEFVGEASVTATEVERSIYGQIRWDF